MMDYKSSGVDIEAGNAFVERLKDKVPTIGGFGGMYKVPCGYEEPILVSGSDGVGTKINIAKINREFTTIGIDLVAMCVNDVITCGAKPLYFLDYISTGKISPIIDQIMEGIIKGCELAGMDLLGGETAEHPRPAPPPTYDDDLDLAGFCTGIVEKSEIIDGSLVRESDVIIGIESSGVHSNGYSLVRKILEMNNINQLTSVTLNQQPIIHKLMKPTYIYSKLVKDLIGNSIDIHGMSHITGGGLPENLPRCFPKGLKPFIDPTAWPRPEIFNWLKNSGNVPELDLWNTFNLGIGFCLVLPSENVQSALDICLDNSFEAWIIGQVEEADPLSLEGISGLPI